MGEKVGKYYTVTISSDNAKMYKYAVSYIKKLEKSLRTVLRKDYLIFDDLNIYPDMKNCKQRILYDYLVETFQSYYHNETYYTVKGYDKKTTESKVYLDDVYNELGENGEYYKLLVKQMKTETLNCSEESDGYTYVYTRTKDNFELYSFDEFIKQSGFEACMKKADFYNEPSEQQYLIYNNDFCDLSDAMKVYAIAESRYFCCSFRRPEFGMRYDYTWEKPEGWKGMKILYENKAVGVCEVHAYYEDMIFTQLGMKSFINSDYRINHAWSVVKAKNSKGKSLWIPFDYGIGPADGLAVSQEQRKYIDTEKRAYKFYLAGIEGAPDYKNFTDEDFN